MLRFVAASELLSRIIPGTFVNIKFPHQFSLCHHWELNVILKVKLLSIVVSKMYLPVAAVG